MGASVRLASIKKGDDLFRGSPFAAYLWCSALCNMTEALHSEEDKDERENTQAGTSDISVTLSQGPVTLV
jgi:hypothetical protein